MSRAENFSRAEIVRTTHDNSAELTLSNLLYKQWVFRYTFLELEKDLEPDGDITTKLFPNLDTLVESEIVVNQEGILAGFQEIFYFLVDSDSAFRPRLVGDFLLESDYQDGDSVSAGSKILKIKANFGDMLAIERVVLNLLMRMSGVATYTSKMLQKIDPAQLLVPTRKSLWGLLDKKAVALGGGGTHRLNLSDAILIKDTHLDLTGHDFESLFRNFQQIKARFFEIEVNSPAAAIELAETFYNSPFTPLNKIPCFILFDNMSLADISGSIEKIKSGGYFENLYFEASGGIREHNLADYAKSGVDVISMGSLTSCAPSLDMSMKMLRYS